MKYLLAIAATAALVALPASAEWISLQRTPEAEELFDSAVVSRDASRITLWTLTNYAKPMTSLEAKEYASEKVLTTVDCSSRKSGAQQVIRYSGIHASGEVVGRMETPLRLATVRPGSTDADLLTRVCP